MQQFLFPKLGKGLRPNTSFENYKNELMEIFVKI
jgi:hypothetical protein